MHVRERLAGRLLPTRSMTFLRGVEERKKECGRTNDLLEVLYEVCREKSIFIGLHALLGPDLRSTILYMVGGLLAE